MVIDLVGALGPPLDPQGALEGVRVDSKTKRVDSKTRFENQIQDMKKTRIPESSKRKNKTEKNYKKTKTKLRVVPLIPKLVACANWFVKLALGFESSSGTGQEGGPDSKTNARFKN